MKVSLSYEVLMQPAAEIHAVPLSSGALMTRFCRPVEKGRLEKDLAVRNMTH